MIILAKILVWFVAIEHIMILIMEMFLWESEFVMKVFKSTPEFASASKILAMNQGLYNGFLAAGLIWALLFVANGNKKSVILFFLGCVVVAGIFGGLTAKFSIIFTQAAPALLAFSLVYFNWETE